MLSIDQDLHIHTYLSACCKDKERQRPRSILELAERMRLRTVGFADHIWVNPGLQPSDWYRPQDETQTARLRADLSSVTTGVRVLVGCEAEMIAPGKIGLTPEYARQLDFVLLACSHLHMKDFVEQPASDAPRDVAKHLIRFFIAGVTSGIATSIAHPFLPCGYMEQFDAVIAAIPDSEFLDAFGQAAGRGVGIEVTTGFLPAPGKNGFSLDTPVRFLSLAKRAGCRFTFATDAHDPEAQKRLPELMQLVMAVGITEGDVLLI
ncbi:hypothetical protein ACFLSJ_09175 [Verrucomicrobiota bacterium]